MRVIDFNAVSKGSEFSMAHKDQDAIDFSKLETELYAALDAEETYWQKNDAKFRAVNQRVATYEEFRDIVLASHLKPLEKKDKMPERFVQPWNPTAAKTKPEQKSTSDSTNTQKPCLVPKNGHEFARDWKRHYKTTEEKYGYLLQIGADNLAKIFKSEISFGLLGELLEALMGYQRSDLAQVVAILGTLANTNRFILSLQFLDSKEKEYCHKLFDQIADDVKSSAEDISEDQIQELMKQYQLKS